MRCVAAVLCCTIIGAWASDQPWTAEWIGPAEEAGRNAWICYRSEVDCPVAPATAELRLACDSKYWLWINGRLTVFEGQLKRGPTPEDTYFDRVPLTGGFVQGRNTIAVLVWHFGKPGFSHHPSGKAGLVFEADLQPGGQRILSGRSWRSRIHPAFYTTAERNPNYRLPEANVAFDARLDLPGWNAPGFDDAAWPAALPMGVPPCAPWNRLVERPIPQWRDSGVRPYADAGTLPRISDGKPVICRLPANIHVTPWFDVEAPAGATIGMVTDHDTIRAEYRTREGRQSYESVGWMNGEEVRYHIPAGVRIHGLGYRETGYDADVVGSFTSSDPDLDTLWTKARRTLQVTMRDTYMDCPDRERAQWWGDEVNELGEAFFVFDAVRGPRLARKGMLELANWQRTDHSLYCPVPAGIPPADRKGGDPHTGTWDNELPQQMLASIGWYGFWTYYRFTGDRQTIAAVYPAVRRYLSLWTQGPDGQAVHRRGGWDWADWGKHADVAVLDSAWLHLALNGAANMADLLGHPDDAAGYRQRMAAISAGFDTAFWKDDAYRSPGHKGEVDDRANALAVVAGLAGRERFPAIRAVLARQEHASPYMEKYVLEALCLMGAPDEALARMKKRYAQMIASPGSTLWELWDGGTINHAWSGGPLTILSQYIAGIAPGGDGWTSVRIAPQPGSLERFTAVAPTPRGPVSVAWRQEGGLRTLRVEVPAGLPATVAVPTTDPTSIQVNGTALPVPGVLVDPADPALLSVAGGSWVISCR